MVKKRNTKRNQRARGRAGKRVFPDNQALEHPRPVSSLSPKASTFAEAITNALADASQDPRDRPLAKLITRYGAILDESPTDSDMHEKIGPRLLQALTAMGMSPAARQASKTETTKDESTDVNPRSAVLARLRSVPN